MDHFLVRERHLIFLLFSSSVFSLKNFFKKLFFRLFFFSVFFSLFSLSLESSFVRVRNFFVVFCVCAFFFIRDREREKRGELSLFLSSRNTFLRAKIRHNKQQQQQQQL